MSIAEGVQHDGSVFAAAGGRCTSPGISGTPDPGAFARDERRRALQAFEKALFAYDQAVETSATARFTVHMSERELRDPDLAPPHFSRAFCEELHANAHANARTWALHEQRTAEALDAALAALEALLTEARQHAAAGALARFAEHCSPVAPADAEPHHRACAEAAAAALADFTR